MTTGPITIRLGHDELVIRKRYEVVSILNDILVALWFIVGSFLFFSEATTYAGTWCFVAGSVELLIRPLIRANDDRVRCAHVVVFFIFIVSNVGGALTPLGDPPLFLGFLKGVDFFWTVRHLLPQTLCLLGVLLALPIGAPPASNARALTTTCRP